MGKQVCYSYCPLSIEELEQFRDEDGFIDLDKVGLTIEEGSRNQVGSADIFKYWIDFAGQKVLLKQEKNLDGENGTLYSDIIMGEICKRFGVQVARTDLFKFRGFRGVMSFAEFNQTRESLIMTRELVGDIPMIGDSYDYKTVEEKINEALTSQFGLSKTEVQKILLQRRLQKIMQLYSSEMDNHLENEGFVFSRDEDGKYQVRVYSMFDDELSFGLHATIEELMTDGFLDGAEFNTTTAPLRKVVRKVDKKEKLTGEEIRLASQHRDRDELIEALMGYMRTRDRIAGNGRQISAQNVNSREFSCVANGALSVIYDDAVSSEEEELDEEQTQEENLITFRSTADFLNKVAGIEQIGDEEELDDEELIELQDSIPLLIEDLAELDIREIITQIEEKYKLPGTIKSQLIRFAMIKREAITAITQGMTEREYYGEMADKLLEYPINQSQDKDF